MARRSSSARERILAAAVSQIAREGIDAVRIARIAVAARVSPSLVHYHFADREALLAEALDYSFSRAADARIFGERPAESHAERLSAMIDACLPLTPALHDDWILWVELWLRTIRHAELRPFAEELYARLHAWFLHEIAEGVAAGEFKRCDPNEVVDRTLALIDGLGIRALIADSAMPLDRARRTVNASLARDLGLGERLVQPQARSRSASAGTAPA
jgi:AcrR family transcriptional regulator